MLSVDNSVRSRISFGGRHRKMCVGKQLSDSNPRPRRSAGLERWGALAKPIVRAGLGTAAILTGSYLLLIAFFAYVDVYNLHFFDADYSRPYSFLRVIFAGYLFWIVTFSGWCLLALVGNGACTVSAAERTALGFFTGASLWTLVMMPLGYLGLYTRTTAVLITAPVVAMSGPHLLRVARGAINALRSWRLSNGLHVIAVVAALAAAISLLLVKGLFPAGGHDYFTHYFYYFTTVLDRHDIWPNEVWYHYYYDKSMGLFFLGALLTDPLAPSLVTFCFAIAAAIALFVLIDRLNPGTLWPWAAVILYFALDIYTVGTGIHAANGGWGDFQKPHEINTAFTIALLWMGARLASAPAGEGRVWWIAAVLCAFVIAYVEAVSAILVGLFFCILAMGCGVIRRWPQALSFFGLATVAGVGLLSVLIINYATTGVPLDNGLQWFWPIVDLRRVERWGVLPEVIQAAASRFSYAQTTLPLTSEAMRIFVKNVFRTEILWRLFGATAAALLAWGLYRVVRVAARGRTSFFAIRSLSAPAPSDCTAVMAVLLALLVSTLCLLATVGREQPISFARYTSFMLPLMLAISIAAWQWITIATTGVPRIRWIFAFVLPAALLVATFAGTGRPYRAGFARVLTNSAKFAGGSFSIYDGYIHQRDWASPYPNDGAVRPWALAVWKELGPGARFWTFGNHTYCMLPRCQVQQFFSMRMSPRSLDIFLGDAPQARAIFQEEALNYFLIEMDEDLTDPLPCSPLFSPERIADYLGIKWTDGTHFLLTWLGPGIEPLPTAWIEAYKKKILQRNNCGYLTILRDVAEQLRKNPRWGADLRIR